MNEAAGINSFSATEMIRFGWETFKKNPWMFLAVLAVAFIISIASSFFAETVMRDIGMAAGIGAAMIDVVVQMFIGIGMIAVALKAHEHIETIHIADLWAPEHFWRYVAASILVGIVVFIGFLALIIPGLILMTMLLFTPYLVVDRRLGPIEAMKESIRITKGHRWSVFFLIILLALLNLVGTLALLVGLLITIPVSLLATVHAYRTLEHEAHEIARPEDVSPETA